MMSPNESPVCNGSAWFAQISDSVLYFGISRIQAQQSEHVGWALPETPAQPIRALPRMSSKVKVAISLGGHRESAAILLPTSPRRASFQLRSRGPRVPAHGRTARHHQPPRTTAAAARVTLLRPCSSTPNFQNCGDDRQCGYTDRTRVRTPHEPNERVAVPTVGVS